MADYFYACARARALEAGLLGKEGLQTLSEASNLDACYAMLEERGYALKKDEKSGAVLREESLFSVLVAAYEEIAELFLQCGAILMTATTSRRQSNALFAKRIPQA